MSTLLLAAVTLGLWLGLLTNWSWSSITANVLHAVAALVWGAAVLLRRSRVGSPASRRVAWGAFVGGVVAVSGPLLLLVPPFTLAAIFGVDEIAHQEIVEQVDFPTGTWRAVVRYRAVGAYAPGQGKIVVTARHRWIPLVEESVVGPVKTDRVSTEGPFVTWLDEERLRLNEHGAVVEVPLARLEAPLSVFMLASLAQAAAQPDPGTATSPSRRTRPARNSLR